MSTRLSIMRPIFCAFVAFAFADKSLASEAEAIEAIRNASGQLEYQEQDGIKKVVGVRLSGPDADEAVLERVSAFKSLKSLNLRSMKITAKSVAKLVELPELDELNCRAMNLPVDAARVLQKTRIAGVSIARCKAQDDAVAELLKMPFLDYLDVSENPNITDVAFANVKQAKRLKYLRASKTQIGDGTAIGLAECPLLTSVDFTQTRLSDVGWVSLMRHPNVQTIRCAGTLVTKGNFFRLR